MKSPLQNTSNYFLNFFNTTTLCQRNSKSLLRSLSSWAWAFFGSLMNHALPGILHGLAASRELVRNSYQLVGVWFIVVGCASSVFYHIFNPDLINRQWYFLNNYYFFYTIREEMLMGFWAVGAFLIMPRKQPLTFLPFAFALGYSVTQILNYWFLVDSMESFHADIALSVWVAGIGIAVGFIVSVDELVYFFHHKRKGNHQRFVGITRMPGVSAEEKMKLFEENCKAYDKLNQII